MTRAQRRPAPPSDTPATTGDAPPATTEPAAEAPQAAPHLAPSPPARIPTDRAPAEPTAPRTVADGPRRRSPGFAGRSDAADGSARRGPPEADGPGPAAPGAAPPNGLAAMRDEASADAGDGLLLQPRPDVFEDAELRSVQSRAVAYLRTGVPVHFRGPAGSGKTTLALHIAARLRRPVTLISGDASLTSADLLGRTLGETTTKVRDRYIQSVERSSSNTRVDWIDGALTRAVEQGHTLVYDEFTRAPADANNALLSALEERIIVFANPARPRRYARAHPEFRAILTSNPDEYAGVTAAPDALFDRMVTFDLTWWALETECGIVARRTGLDPAAAATVVRLVRVLRRHVGGANPPSIRTAVMIGRIVAAQGVPASPRDERFVQICLDVLETRAPRSPGGAGRDAYLADLRAAILAARQDPAPSEAVA